MVEWGDCQNLRGVRLAHPPPIIPGYVAPYYTAFQDLYWSRNNGLGQIGGIPLSAILEYTDRISPKNLDFFIDIIQMMDHLYLDKIREKRNNQNQ